MAQTSNDNGKGSGQYQTGIKVYYENGDKEFFEGNDFDSLREARMWLKDCKRKDKEKGIVAGYTISENGIVIEEVY